MGEGSEMNTPRRRSRRGSERWFEGQSAVPVDRFRVEPGDRARQGPASLFERFRADGERRGLSLGIDIPLLLTIITLVIIGLIMVYSASYDYSRSINLGDSMAIFMRQLQWVALGLAAAMVTAVFDYHRLTRLAVPLMVVTIVMLLYVAVLGPVINNASRTLIDKSGQPSEMAKLVMIIYLAVWINSHREQFHDMRLGLAPLALILGVVGFLIYRQPDLSAALTVVVLGIVLFGLAGADWKQTLLFVGGAALIGALLLTFSATGQDRLSNFERGLQDLTQGSYHVRRAVEAFVNGGWFGVGLGNSATAKAGLPVPQTDSIFAVVGEEFGFFGSVALIGIYAFFMWRGFSVARRAPDLLGQLIAAGITFWISFEAFVNMAVMVNVLPSAGNALPLISSGGSSMVFTLAGLGILLGISRAAVQKEEDHGRLFRAVIDLRWWDRRRRVSGARRPANPSTDGT
jgi:cell division protein FtsW